MSLPSPKMVASCYLRQADCGQRSATIPNWVATSAPNAKKWSNDDCTQTRRTSNTRRTVQLPSGSEFLAAGAVGPGRL
jgi:hypothetical protein